MHGGRDQTVPYASGKTVYDAVPWPKAFLTLPDGDHAGGLLGDGGRGIRTVVGTTLDFLRWSLYGDAAARRRLGQQAQDGVATLDDQL